MRKIVGIVIDDNQAHVDTIIEHSAKLEWAEITKSFTDPEKGMAYVRKFHVDFIILDVEMNSVSGLDLMQVLPNQISVILYTGFEKYEDEAYQRKALDVVHKPTSFTRFAVAMERVKKQLGLNIGQKELLEGDDYYFNIKGHTRYMRTLIRFKELIYIESIDGRIHFHLVGEKNPRVCNEPFKRVKSVLPAKWFMQIHMSYIINTDFYRGYLKGEVEMTVNELRLKTGRPENYRDFFEWVNTKVV